MTFGGLKYTIKGRKIWQQMEISTYNEEAVRVLQSDSSGWQQQLLAKLSASDFCVLCVRPHLSVCFWADVYH